MTTVLVAHSALGLRPAVLDLADRVRALGFPVVAPDLFGGAVFEGGPQGYAAAIDAEPAARLVAEAARAGSDVSDYVYPGRGHLFMDAGLPDEHDSGATDLFFARVQGFLSRFTA